MKIPGLKEVRQAREQIRDHVHRTPIVSSATLGRLTGQRIHLKLENLQKTGSFKPRGALSHLASLSSEVKHRGVVTISAGNHAQALAFASRVMGFPVTVVMPAGASRAKAEAARDYGAEVILHGDVGAAFEKTRELEHEKNLHFVHPFDDPLVVAGQATVGLEVLEDLEDLDLLMVGIGGGGLISGVAMAVKELRPRVRVIGVEPVGADTMFRSRKQGKPARIERVETIADGLGAPFAGELNFQLVEKYVDDLVTVTDRQILEAMKLLFERCKVVAEPAGAAALAPLLGGLSDVPTSSRVCCLVSGGNIGMDQISHLFADEDSTLR